MKKTIIAAVAENGVIGKERGIPWDIPEEQKFFRKETNGHPVIMGRTTFMSIVEKIGHSLPNRINVVLSNEFEEKQIKNVLITKSTEEAIDLCEEFSEEVYIAGGRSVYEQFLPEADRMLISKINRSPNGDTHFPDWNEDEWELTWQSKKNEYTVLNYERL